MSASSKRALTEDASNRALRTFLTGLAIDIAVGIALVLTTVFATANGWGDLETAVLTFSIAKSVVQSICSFVLRRFLDGSVPTPLPPTPQPAPTTPDPAP